MYWRMDDWGLLSRVSPFRYLRINGYLLLPEAFRSLSRLSSALSAKASTLRSSSLDRVVMRSTLFGFCEQQPHHVSRLLLFRKNGIFAGHDNTGLYDCVSFSFSFLRVDNGSYIALYSIICFWNWIHFNQLNWVILHLISDVLIYLRCHIFRCSTSFRSITYLYEVFKVHIDCFISHQKTQSFLNSLTTGKSSVYLNSSSLCNGWYTFRTSMFRWSVRLGLCERLSHTSFSFFDPAATCSPMPSPA